MNARPVEPRWNTGARLSHCPLKGEFEGKPWREVATAYLRRIVAELAHKPDIVSAASRELEQRREPGSDSTHTSAPPSDPLFEAPARPVQPLMAEHNARMTREANEAFYRRNPGGPMPHISQMITSKYLNKEDCRTPVVVTISGVAPETFGGGRGGQGAETKWILHFRESRKGLKLNTTLISTLAAAFGEQSEAWVGQKVRLYVDNTVMMAGQIVGGIRIQTPRGTVEAAGFAKPSAFEQGVERGGRGDAFERHRAEPGDRGGRGETFDTATGEIRGAGAPGNQSPGPTSHPDFDDDIPF